jgi:hypothetical protein
MFGMVYAFFKIQNAMTKGGIRSEEAHELAGLDLPEMGVLAYPEFALTTTDDHHDGNGNGNGNGAVRIPAEVSGSGSGL